MSVRNPIPDADHADVPTRRQVILGAAALGAAALGTSVPALAARRGSGQVFPVTRLPMIVTHSKRIDREQNASTRLEMQVNGLVNIVARWSNGRRLDGDRLATMVMFGYSDGRTERVKLRKGLNASFFGGTRKARKTARHKIDPTRLGRLAWVGIDSWHDDKVDDAAVARALVEVATVIFGEGEAARR